MPTAVQASWGLVRGRRGKSPRRDGWIFQFSDLSFFGGALEPKFLDTIADLIAIQPEQRGGLRLVPSSAIERLDDKRPFELFEIQSAGRQLYRLAEPHGDGAAGRKIVRVEHRPVRQQHRALDRIAQFA